MPEDEDALLYQVVRETCPSNRHWENLQPLVILLTGIGLSPLRHKGNTTEVATFLGKCFK